MEITAKKIGLLAVLGYAGFWVYNNVYHAVDRLLYGSIGWGSIVNGSIILTLPISNVGQLPLKMTGMTGQLILLNEYAIGEVQQVTATTFAPNTTQVLRITVTPNWLTLISVVGSAAVAAIRSGQVGAILSQFQPKLKCTIFTPAFTESFEKQIA